MATSTCEMLCGIALTSGSAQFVMEQVVVILCQNTINQLCCRHHHRASPSHFHYTLNLFPLHEHVCHLVTLCGTGDNVMDLLNRGQFNARWCRRWNPKMLCNKFTKSDCPARV